jgi:hypothetical protein
MMRKLRVKGGIEGDDVMRSERGEGEKVLRSGGGEGDVIRSGV